MIVNSFAELNEYKGKIKALCLSTQDCLEELGRIYHQYTYASAEGLKHLLAKLGQANFKVVVIGKFSTGKSSLINALLGEFVLPDSLSPCTAYINEITYGEEKQATIYFKNPLPEKWEDFVQNESVKEHIRKHCAGVVPEFVIPLEDLAECVTIPWNEDEDDVFESNMEFDISPFAKAVIQYPCELLKNGIEIIDSPGLDENQDRTEIVDKYLKRVDAVIYVMTNIATGGDSDKEIIRTYLSDNDIKNVFFVCNLFGIPLKMAQKQLFGRLKKVFGDKTLLGEKGIHLVNIRDMNNTGVADFEAALANYLNNEKGIAQLNSYVEALTKLDNTIIEDAATYECIHDVKLQQIDKEIATLKALLEEDKDIFTKARALVEESKEQLVDFCRREVMERFKKINYEHRASLRDVERPQTVIPGDADTGVAELVGGEIAIAHTMGVSQDLRRYAYEELTAAIGEDLLELTQALEQQVRAFAVNLQPEAYAEAKVDHQAPSAASMDKLSPVPTTIAQGFNEALVLEYGPKFDPRALNTFGNISAIAQNVFDFYASYQNENRGAKLSAELRNQVTVDIYKKLERAKRGIVEYTIQQLLEALDKLVYTELLTAMEAEIAYQQKQLADKEALRLVILDHQADEHLRSDRTLAQLQADLQKLAAL